VRSYPRKSKAQPRKAEAPRRQPGREQQRTKPGAQAEPASRDREFRKKAEADLRRSEALLRQTERISHVGGWEYDIRTKQNTWTEGTYRLHGVSKNTFDPNDLDKVLEFYPPEDRQRVLEAFRLAIERGTPYDLEVGFRSADGDRKHVRIMAQAERKGGKIVRVFGNIMDVTERRKAEEKLRESEEKYRTLFEQADDSLILFDTQTARLTDFNEAACRHLGYTRKEFARLKVSDIEAAESAEELRSHIQAVVAAGSAVFETRHRTKAGAILDREIRSKAIRIGGRILLQNICRDITARKRMERELRESEEKYKALVETTDTGYVILDGRGRALDANSEYVRLTGRKAISQILGRSVIEWTAPHDRKRNAAEVRKCIARGFVRNLEVDYITPAGQCIPVEVNATLLQGSKKPCIVTLCRDISRRRLAEESLRESESSYRNLFNTVEEAIYIQDRNGRFVDVNRGAVEMYGHPKAFFIGQTPEIVSAPGRNDLAAITRAVRRAFDGKRQRFEFWGLRSNGEVFPKEVHLTKGNYFGREVIIALALDITERKRAESALKEVHDTLEQKVRDRTAELRTLATRLVRAEEQERQRIAQILHEDLQQMLTGARFMLKDLRERQPRQRAKHVADRISHVLEGATAVARTLTLDLRPPSLYEAGLIAGLKWLANDMKARFGLALQVQMDEAAEPASNELKVFVFGAVRELLLNVIKHAGVKKARLNLSLPDRQTIHVEVKDRGKGFTAMPGRPTGFGLFSLRERTESLGGSLRVRSSRGNGTSVTLIVPTE
jgi:PAS domain S-box-containing protein